MSDREDTNLSALPPRSDYPPPSRSDMADAIRAAEGDRKATHRRGRYSASMDYVDHTHTAREGWMVVVKECDRHVIAMIPEDYVDAFLRTLKEADRD